MSKIGKLIVNPIGGLANRMRVLAYGYYIAKKCDCLLECKWTINNDLHAPFESIFKQVSFPIENVYEPQYLLRKHRDWWHHIRKNVCANICLFKDRIDEWFPSNLVDDIIRDRGSSALCDIIESYLKQGKVVYLATCEDLGDYTDISFLAPTDIIMGKVSMAMAVFEKGHSYGLHIRRTDNNFSIEQSPIELFENTIDVIIKRDSFAKFYLATDDLSTAQYLSSKYSNRIIYRDKELSRSTENGIIEAVVDMWILGSMDVIYGSYWSSYSIMASWINNIPVHIIKKE